MTAQILTQENLKKVLHYCPSTGIFIWLITASNIVKPGDVAGHKSKIDGYTHICVNNKKYRAHRLAWFYVYGYFPQNQLDHGNHNRSDNRMQNLSEATNQENCKNMTMKSNNTSGVTGIWFDKALSKWRPGIKLNGKTKHLGSFVNFNDAVIVRKMAEYENGFHANHGCKQ